VDEQVESKYRRANMNSSECDSANITQHTDYVIGCLAIILGVLVVVFNVILVVIIKSSKILHELNHTQDKIQQDHTTVGNKKYCWRYMLV
jgi:hypothetical protein